MEKAAAAFEPKLIGIQEVINQKDGLKSIHKDWLDRNKPANIPNVVYHYTNTAAFLDIIEKGEMFATHIQFLNDYTEYVHAMGLFFSVVKHCQTTELAEIIHNPLKTIHDTLAAFQLEDIPPVCVICFSEARDDLTQWRAYGPGESGIGLGMNLGQLYHSALFREIELHPVIYDESKQFDLVWSLIYWGCRRIAHLAETVDDYKKSEWVREWITQFTYSAAYFAPLFKGKEWESEKEWRVIKWCVNPADTKVMKAASGLRIRSVLDLKWEIENEHGKKNRLPVEEVLLAPQSQQQERLTRMALTKHLQDHDYIGVNISSSKVPLR